uniref:Histone-lysine N-methyltransferase SETDB1-like n=1 Tax=Phallusia mammillata TaxID=59560 RepID=A0A6F9DSL4_9ASCI|nr:histone-lysine N-methyltransferase SETDB1-like [Phallusia mammillata]
MDFKVRFGDEYDDLLQSMIEEATKEFGLDEKLDDEFKRLNNSLDENVMSKLSDAQALFDKISDDVTKLELDSAYLQQEINKQHSNEVITVDDDIPPITMQKTEDSNRENVPTARNKVAVPQQQEKIVARKFKPSSRLLAMHLYTNLEVLALCKDEWKKALIVDQQKHKDKMKFKVQFVNNNKAMLHINQLACIDSADKFEMSEVNVGMRVAAGYRNEGIYSGVIAEASDKKMNNNRLLIFFDDGYAAYCQPRQVHLVYGLRRDVWNDISCKATASYIKSYLSTAVRQLLTIRVGQTLKVEFEGEWHIAKCLKVDGSLVEILYLSDNSKELIYRGSMRLEPLYRKHHGVKTKNERQGAGNRIARAHTGMRKAHIEYTTIDLTRDSSPPEVTKQPRKKSFENSQSTEKKMQVRKEGQWEAPWEKSLSAQQSPWKQIPSHVTHIPKSYSEMQGGVDVASYIMNRFEQKQREQAASKHDDSKPRSRSIDQAQRSASSSRKIENRRSSANVGSHGETSSSSHLIPHTSSPYVPHKCGSRCIAPFQLRRTFKGTNPLLKPLLFSWTRELSRIPHLHRSTFHVHYRGPCGRACRNMKDVQRYMMECGIRNLDFINFSFDPSIRVQENTEIKTRDAKIFIKDYSNGKEDIPISCVNEINMEEPPKMPYTKTRVPGRGVKINTNTDFMVCCDCPDNCSDRSKCPCQQLTVQATSCCRGGKIKPDAGYQYKRLYSFLPTGIYECNSRCKCKSQCLNRVVQLGLQCRLQMFKTQKKGWGIRCLDDIAQGTFVCIYTGKIQTEANANDEGLMNGDEYLAELDHIEVAENQKQDYNNDDNSSGIDSLSEPDFSDDESCGNKKQKTPPEQDSTDTEGEAPECVKMVFKRQSGTTWSISSDGNEQQVFEDKPAKPFCSGSKKLGYSSDPEVSPGIIPDSVRRRRGRNMVARSNLPSNDSSADSETGGIVYELPKRSSVMDEETTDTDSDTNGSSSRRPASIAVKSSGIDKMDKLALGNMDSDEEEVTNKTRRLFGQDGAFIIDAKQTGNLGRYLNHSCTPNLMVQNVFIDTHDLRFPWVAFFASSTIRAGTELTWDYNYEIGSVDDRVIHCYCGSTKCRKRLL